MQRLKKALLPCALILTLSMVFLGTAAARTANRGRLSNAYTQTTALQCGSWSVVASPNVSTGDTALGAVAAVSANDIWAAGQALNDGGPDQPLVEHWDGSAWSVVTLPHTSLSGALYGITASSENAWAVGDLGSPTAPMKNLVTEKDDARWSIVSNAQANTQDNQLFAVTAANNDDLWAVGNVLDPSSGNYATLIEHSDGQNWSIVPSPNPGGSAGNNILGGVVALSSHDVWAVGGYDNGGNTMTLIEHYC